MNTVTVKSYMAKPGELEQKWWLVDASDKVVGRLASDLAMILMGKHRPTYTPHVDCGDYVVVVNVEKIVLSGKKWDQKQYTWTTGYPGLRSESARTRFEREPERILYRSKSRRRPGITQRGYKQPESLMLTLLVRSQRRTSRRICLTKRTK